MTTSPFAQAQMSIDGNSPVMGGVTLDGLGHTLQLSGVSTTAWENDLWAIWEYPVGFSLPSGWTNVNGIYVSSDVQPSIINIPPAATLWGKYFFRLIVNQGLLDGVYMGPGSPQPLVDIASAVRVYSPLGQIDVGFGETNQFDTARQWNGEYKANLRILEQAVGPIYRVPTADATPVFVPLVTLAAGDVRQVDVIAKVAKADGTVRQVFKLSALYYGAAGPVATIDGSISSAATGTGSAAVTLDASGADVRLKITAGADLVTSYEKHIL